MIFNPTGADQTIRCYKDGGNVVNVTTDFRYQQNPAGALYIGPLEYLGNRPSYSGFVGNLDEIAVWNTDISEGTIEAIYNTTNDNPGKAADLLETPEGAPVAWYRMGD